MMIHSQATQSDRLLLRIDRINKAYGGVQALQDVSFEVGRGEVHALCGENGAGKSTLIKLLTGVTRPDSGSLVMNQGALPVGNVRGCEAAGIAVLHQESTAFPDLNAIDNIFVGRELRAAGGFLLARDAMRREAAELLEQLGESIDLTVPLGQLPLAQRQMVSMARAMSCQCQLFIMDEPTASLSAQESQKMLMLVNQLKEQGISILYVSHRLEEIFQVADAVTVLRDGQYVATHAVEDLDDRKLIQLMVGRELDELTVRQTISQPKSDETQKPSTLKVDQLSRQGIFQDVSFSIAAGEIVGMAGLVGAGRSEIARAIFGIDSYDEGTVEVNGEILPSGSVARAKHVGMAMVPEDRQHEGLVLPMSVQNNLTLANLRDLQDFGWLSQTRERGQAKRLIADLDIRVTDPRLPVETLSGGNQQKVVIGKWLASMPNLLILDEPTRGVDVAAKAQVHRLIRELADEGMATLMISSELSEILTLSDRILVIHQGRIAAEFEGATATQEQLLHAALVGSAP